MKNDKENREKLLQLIRENPDLPIVPMVDSEVVADDFCAYWMGSWGSARIDQFLDTGERIFFSDDDPEDVLTEIKGWDWYSEATDEDIDAEFKALPWERAIVVYINS